MEPCIAKRVFYITNEMQLTHVKCFCYYQCSTRFGRYFRPSSGAYETVCVALGVVMLSCCLPLVWLGSIPSRKSWKYPRLDIQFKSSWWWAEIPPETCRALIITKNIVYVASRWLYKIHKIGNVIRNSIKDYPTLPCRIPFSDTFCPDWKELRLDPGRDLEKSRPSW